MTSPHDARFQWLADRLQRWEQQGLRRQLVPRQHRGVLLVHGDQTVVNFGSNDYLGYGAEMFDFKVADIDELSSGAGASPLVSGYSPLHQRLCEELIALEQTEAAVLFPSGYAACSSLLATLPEAGDVILSDALNHASLIDGCRLSKAERFIYPHRDLQGVRQLLQIHRRRFRNAFLVTDSIFSMEGTLAPLEALAELAESFDAILIVDEAHATGLFGTRGSGLCEALGIEHRVPLRIGTLSKAVGASGGFVAGPQVVIDYLLHRARALIYSTAASPLSIAAAIHGLRRIRHEPARRKLLEARIGTLARLLAEQMPKTKSTGTAIQPLLLGDANETVSLARRLLAAGFYVPPIRPPTVPDGTSRLRISLSAAHEPEQLVALIAEIARNLPRSR